MLNALNTLLIIFYFEKLIKYRKIAPQKVPIYPTTYFTFNILL